MAGRWSAGRAKAWAALALMAFSVVVWMAGCKPLPPSKPEAQFTAAERRGQQVFAARCARCHYPTTTQGLHGPGLQVLTKLKAMPSGAPPTDERLTQTILQGHGMMAPVAVSSDELTDLLAYLHTL